ncbi:helix-turn-helix transcriptional regulator [Peijinzhouia sedimentorum]
MDQNQIIGLNLRRYRESLNLTQDMLASYLGINREEVSYFETGKRIMPSALLNKAAKLFGIDEYDFYDSDEAADVKIALAFRAETLSPEDLHHIADFRKIVLNYLGMKKFGRNESAHS